MLQGKSILYYIKSHYTLYIDIFVYIELTSSHPHVNADPRGSHENEDGHRDNAVPRRGTQPDLAPSVHLPPFRFEQELERGADVDSLNVLHSPVELPLHFLSNILRSHFLKIKKFLNYKYTFLYEKKLTFIIKKTIYRHLLSPTLFEKIITETTFFNHVRRTRWPDKTNFDQTYTAKK